MKMHAKIVEQANENPRARAGGKTSAAQTMRCARAVVRALISYATARDENEKSVCVEDCDTYLALFKEKHSFNLSLDVREQRDDLLKEKQKKIDEYNAGKKLIYKQERAEAIRKEIKAKYIRRDADGNFEGFKTKVHNGPLDWVKLESEEEVKEQFAFIDKQVKLAIGLLG